MDARSNISGILVVDKPTGLTSRDVVNRVSKILHTKRIGHTGTLDPMATGVLILTIGKCTKLSDFLTSKDKEYIASFVLGYETDTLDDTGTTTKTSSASPRPAEIEKCIQGFQGTYDQEVPIYSAVRVSGKRLYEYAREDKKIDLPKREVNISSIEILSIEEDEITIKTTVSKGTYIRSLIRDIGVRLGTYATMTSLRRTKQGKTTLAESYTLAEIEEGNFKITEPLEVLKDIKTYELTSDEYKKVSNGVKMPITSDSQYIKFIYNDRLIALYEKDENLYKMYVKFE